MSTGYVVHCREVTIDGKRHETGVEFRKDPWAGFYESRRVITDPKGVRWYGPWERMEANSK